MKALLAGTDCRSLFPSQTMTWSLRSRCHPVPIPNTALRSGGKGRRAQSESFAALFGGVGFAASLIEGGGERGVGGGGVGVGDDGVFELHDGVDDLPAFEQERAAIEAEAGFLAVDGDPSEIRGDLALMGGVVFLPLCGEDGEGDVGAGLLGCEGDGALEGWHGFLRLIHLAIDTAEGGPGVAVAGVQGKCFFEAGGGFGEAALLHEEDAEGEGRVGKRGIERGGTLKLGDGGGEVVLEFEGESEVVVQLRAVGI